MLRSNPDPAVLSRGVAYVRYARIREEEFAERTDEHQHFSECACSFFVATRGFAVGCQFPNFSGINRYDERNIMITDSLVLFALVSLSAFRTNESFVASSYPYVVRH